MIFLDVNANQLTSRNNIAVRNETSRKHTIFIVIAHLEHFPYTFDYTSQAQL